MKLLWNPFEKFNESRLMLWGSMISIIGTLISWKLDARFDGVIDLHFYENINLATSFADLLSNVLISFLIVFIAAKLVNAKTRAIDILVSAIIARAPFYLMPLFNCTGSLLKTSKLAEENLGKVSPEQLVPAGSEMVLIAGFGLFTILSLVWFFALFFNGYKVASNAKGLKPVFLFIAAIILAEIASKFNLHLIDQLLT